jgi:hypothetical protein
LELFQRLRNNPLAYSGIGFVGADDAQDDTAAMKVLFT